MNTVSVPLPDFVKNGNTLTEWLGLFWTRIYENADFVQSFEHGQGLLAAQLYLDYLENIDLIDRNTVPVFHRERWKPIVIKRSDRGKGNANLLRVGMTPPPKVGPQPAGTPYVEGEVYKVGGHAEFTNATSYPLPDGLTDVMTCICDNIAVPKTVLIRGTDFIIRENTIFFLRNNDPFDDPNFPRRVTTEEGHEDEEILLWTVDALIDRDYVYRHLGYVMGLETESTEFYRKMINGLWDLYNLGTPISIVKSGLGALLGEPTIIHTREVVELIRPEDQYLKIVTDKEVYDVSLDATLREEVVVGAVLRAGEFLTETIRLYETLDPMKLAAANEYGERLRDDLYSLFFDDTLMRAPLRFGVGASWELSDIVNTGFDANGNPKLKCDLYGTASDIDAFWNDFWQYLEDHNISSETCFEAYLDDIVVPVVGAVYGRVPPLEYFMRYFLKANAMVIVVERDRLTSGPTDRDPVGLLTFMQDVIPAHIFLFVVEQRHLEPEEYDMTLLGSEIERTYATDLASQAYPGGPSTVRMTYLDRPPIMRWIPQCA
jgi:hypothetical protein